MLLRKCVLKAVVLAFLLGLGSSAQAQTYYANAEIVTVVFPQYVYVSNSSEVSVTVKNTGNNTWSRDTVCLGVGPGAPGNYKSGPAWAYVYSQPHQGAESLDRVWLPYNTFVGPGQTYTFTYATRHSWTKPTYVQKTVHFQMVSDSGHAWGWPDGWFGGSVERSYTCVPDGV